MLSSEPVANPVRAIRVRHGSTSRVKYAVRGFDATKQVAGVAGASNFEEGGLVRWLWIVFVELNEAASLRMSVCRVPDPSSIAFLWRDDSGQCRDIGSLRFRRVGWQKPESGCCVKIEGHDLVVGRA